MTERSYSIALCYGTRPQIIKASSLRAALGAIGPVLTVDTGQHYDFELNELQYRQLGVAEPDLFLEVGSGSQAEQTAAVMTGCERVLREVKPSAVVVVGDTNSTLGAALGAAKLRIPVVHIEAGLRSRDAMMAEEINRRVVDAISALCCAPSRTAMASLEREGRGSAAVWTGDVSRGVLELHLPNAPAIPPARPDGRYAYCTLHRAELTNDVPRLVGILELLGRLPLRVILAMHPRTRAALGGQIGVGGALEIMPPQGYLESLALTRDAAVIITDSGGVQREAYWLGVPCVTLRDETEWVETVACGANQLVSPGEASRRLLQVVEHTLEAPPHGWDRDLLGTGDAGRLVTEAVRSFLGSGVAG